MSCFLSKFEKYHGFTPKKNANLVDLTLFRLKSLNKYFGICIRMTFSDRKKHKLIINQNKESIGIKLCRYKGGTLKNPSLPGTNHLFCYDKTEIKTSLDDWLSIFSDHSYHLMMNLLSLEAYSRLP